MNIKDLDPKSYTVDEPKNINDLKPGSYSIDPGINDSKPTDVSGALNAGLQKYGQGLTSGYLNSLQAAAEPATNAILNLLTGNNVQTPDYETRKKENVAREKQLEQDHPVASTIGTIAGIGNQALALPGAGKALGIGADVAGEGIANASKIAKIAKGALGGATQGFVQNPGDDLSGQNAFDARLSNAKFGGLLGGGGEAALMGLKGAADIYNAKDPILNALSNKTAVKTMVPMRASYLGMGGQGLEEGTQKVGKFLQEEGLVGPGKTANSVRTGLENIINEEGPKIGSIVKKANDKLADPEFIQSLDPKDYDRLAENALDGPATAQEIMDKVSDKLGNHPQKDAILGKLDLSLEGLRNMGTTTDPASISEFNQYRQGLDDVAYTSQMNKEPTKIQSALRDARNIIKSKVDNNIGALDSVLDSNDLAKLKESNARISQAYDTLPIAKRGEAKILAMQMPSILHPMQTTNYLSKKFGPGIATGLLNAVQTASKYDPIGLAGRAGSSVASPLVNNPLMFGSALQNTNGLLGGQNGK